VANKVTDNNNNNNKLIYKVSYWTKTAHCTAHCGHKRLEA